MPSREGEVSLTNSMAGKATRLWFKQLRRLQSLKHAVHASKQDASAVAYRVELWQAIKRAKGFFPDFTQWWNQAGHEVEGVPHILPTTVPTESAIASALFDSFHLHFRAFETWHLKERSQSLRLKYAGSLEAVFLDLRKDPRPGVNLLWKDHPYTVLAVDPTSQQVHFDQPVQTNFDSVWIHDGHLLNVAELHADLGTVSSVDQLAPGDLITHRTFLTDTTDVPKAFETHWTSRWNNLAQISSDDWQRMVDFAQHYMPQLHFHWEPIDVHT